MWPMWDGTSDSPVYPGICYPVFIHFVLKGDFLQVSDSENIARRGSNDVEAIITGRNYGNVT